MMVMVAYSYVFLVSIGGDNVVVQEPTMERTGISMAGFQWFWNAAYTLVASPEV
jgi:hypothetical protein